jgi:uncharacterized protein YycO
MKGSAEMRFKHGTVVMTKGISDTMKGNFKFFNDVMIAFNRYVNCDWGDLCSEDKAINEDAVKTGQRLLGKYPTSEGAIYIITEWDRSITTILFPDEY